MKYFVNSSAAPGGDGSQAKPFAFINDAAKIALPGDEVLVCPGVYREAVNPIHGGTEAQPIVYRSMEPKQAVITGAEPLRGWQNVKGSVWTARVNNALFVDRNPYTTLEDGETFWTGEALFAGEAMVLACFSFRKISEKSVEISRGFYYRHRHLDGERQRHSHHHRP